jgi:hypothetical protein
LIQTFFGAHSNPLLADVVATRLLGECGTPLCEGLPAITLGRWRTLPALLEYLVCVKRQTIAEERKPFAPCIRTINEIPFGHRGKGSRIA